MHLQILVDMLGIADSHTQRPMLGKNRPKIA